MFGYSHLLFNNFLTFRGLALRQREKGLSGEGPMLKTLDYTAYWQYTNLFFYTKIKFLEYSIPSQFGFKEVNRLTPLVVVGAASSEWCDDG